MRSHVHSSIFILFIYLFIFPLPFCYTQETVIDVSIFKPLDEELKKHQWNLSNSIKASIFEKIYLQYHSDPLFHNILDTYLSIPNNNDTDRYYWIGIYLNEPYYTKINDFNLSIHILTEGLSRTKKDEDKVPFYFVIGKTLFHQNQPELAAIYLIPGYKLSLEYPGCVPTFDSIAEYNQIMEFIKEHLQD